MMAILINYGATEREWFYQMYEYLTGKVTLILPTHVVVEVAGMGYKLLTANPFIYQENQTVTIYVEQIVRENEISLYGFADMTAKMLFNKLLSVSGIGPKSALAILANADQSALIGAVESQNVEYLVKFPGIGKKTAQQIVLDLKGKLADIPGVALDLFTEPVAVANVNKELSDAILALESLGYGKTDIKRVEKHLAKAATTDTQTYLSLGLKYLMG
ncbi:Holliday junction ATP-dependent DNA helicase RuvA [Periweissella fabaria]|uniref:Holliday junction branch migration complex subunit RuvA n=2 Tax=Periweissella fabaria TaxID=546157 RepID=A0ABM8Z8T0_9LACO|nr:Holliday junction ATP-dependent DNA helicase RuvA [Periweissella fabaria]